LNEEQKVPAVGSQQRMSAHSEPMTDQAILIEMARLLSIIERHWASHFSTGNEIDALTSHQVRVEYRQRYPRVGVDGTPS
jgi:hypothetical protein